MKLCWYAPCNHAKSGKGDCSPTNDDATVIDFSWMDLVQRAVAIRVFGTNSRTMEQVAPRLVDHRRVSEESAIKTT